MPLAVTNTANYMSKILKKADSDSFHKTLEQDDGGFGIVVGILKQKRRWRRMTVAKLSRFSGVPEDAIKQLEAGEFASAKVRDLLLISRVLKCHAGVALVPQRDTVPTVNESVLKSFDRLIKSSKAIVFICREVDKQLGDVTWDVVGDPDKNWLYVIASNRRKRVRFGRISDAPGSWPIRGQSFGVDVETGAVARRLSASIIQRHRKELK